MVKEDITRGYMKTIKHNPRLDDAIMLCQAWLAAGVLMSGLLMAAQVFLYA